MVLEPGSMELRELFDKYGGRLSFVGKNNMDTLAKGCMEDGRAEVRDSIARVLQSLDDRERRLREAMTL